MAWKLISVFDHFQWSFLCYERNDISKNVTVSTHVKCTYMCTCTHMYVHKYVCIDTYLYVHMYV